MALGAAFAVAAVGNGAPGYTVDTTRPDAESRPTPSVPADVPASARRPLDQQLVICPASIAVIILCLTLIETQFVISNPPGVHPFPVFP